MYEEEKADKLDTKAKKKSEDDCDDDCEDKPGLRRGGGKSGVKMVTRVA
jgi:hypothetical protein